MIPLCENIKTEQGIVWQMVIRSKAVPVYEKGITETDPGNKK